MPFPVITRSPRFRPPTRNSDAATEHGIRQAIANEPHYPHHHLIYADFLDEHNRPQEAAHHRNIGGVLTRLGNALSLLDPDAPYEAHTAFHSLFRLEPQEPGHHTAYANWLAQPEAIAHYGTGENNRAGIAHHRAIARALQASSRFVTKDVAATLHHGQTLYHTQHRNRDGTAMRTRVNGKLKTWKTRPDDFNLPTKYGFIGSGIPITPYSQLHWMTHDLTEYEEPRQSRRRR